MADGDRLGKEPAAAPAEDKFPEGLRVLAVDDDPVCCRLLLGLLRLCKYNATVVSDAVTALEMLREGGGEQFDLVMTDVHMPGMDGFKLLELIGLEMDLPVIMLSANEEKETVLKGITHGACDYLVKPVQLKELRNIWQHVIRKNPGLVNHSSSDSDEVEQPVIVDGEDEDAKRKKCSRKKKHDNEDGDSDRNKESTRVKKPRVSWTGPLHNRFIEVVHHLGVDKAVPKTILQMMEVDTLTRECVASHLQKYRLYLKRLAEDPKKAKLHGNCLERRNSFYYMNMMNRQGSSDNYYERHSHMGWASSAVGHPGPNNLYPAPSVIENHDSSIRPMNWTMGTVGHGHAMPHAVPWLPDAGRHHPSDPPLNLFTNISSDRTKMNALPPTFSSKPYTGLLCEKLLEAGIVEPSSNPGSSSLAEMPNGGMQGPVNQFPVQPPELVSEFFGVTNAAPPAVGERRVAQFPHFVGSSTNPWQHVASSSSFPAQMDIGAPLAQTQLNFPQINQLQGFGASPGQMHMFQNEQQNAGIVNNNTTSVVAFSEPMTPLFDMASNMAPVGMSNDNFLPMAQMVNGGSIVPTFPESFARPPAQMVNAGSIGGAFAYSSAAPSQMLNPGDASGILPVQEGPAAADEQALDDQPNYTSAYFPEDNFSSMLNQEFSDDAIFGRGF